MRLIDISVIMSVYREPLQWLRVAIESILNQTIDNFEFLIVVDNPNDSALLNFLKYFQDLDSRVRVIINDENIGLTSSLNKALKLARGRYIARMDADDICFNNRLELQYNFLENNIDYVACGANAYLIYDDRFTNEMFRKPEKDSLIKAFLFFESPILHPALFFRNLDMYYDENFIVSQDFEFISRLALRGKLYNIQEPLLYYRRSLIQISSKKMGLQNNLATIVRKTNIEKVINTDYDVFLKKLDFSSSNLSNLDRGAIVYSMLFYNKLLFIKKARFVFCNLYFINFLPLKYSLRLYLSFFKTFNDQKK